MRPVTDDNDPMYCETCKEALERLVVNGRPVDYRHKGETIGARRANHKPVPVPLSTLAGARVKCDFCDRLGPTWVYHVTDEQVDQFRRVTRQTVALGDYQDRHQAARVLSQRTENAGPQHHWGEGWAACEGCAALIEARDLLGLVARVVDTLPTKLTRGKRLIGTRGTLIDNYSGFFSTLAPGRGRITPSESGGPVVMEES